MEVLHQVTKAYPIGDFKVAVEFDFGDENGIYDCRSLLKDKYWAKLADSEFFNTAHAEYGTIVWSDNIDVAPESVWENCTFLKT